ncbi:hypothetical protein [Micromonospora sp. WMMC250]|uniref:hypothetical protein n=1 Tax=Micromonospora sp. WMMC250 TaxID=3014781 RepID=UPI0022B6EEEA|nr:hypothetical protein [Micromonospora sp. WMMC250]MCZ7376553.1 hypothetical protein [Micromonospora sp. WMMC250]
MSYPTGDSLTVRIRIAFGASIAADPNTWAWTDVTTWWHTPDDVRIGWGRSTGAGQAEESTLTLTLKNTDGRFTAYDARSPYWPNVRRWTPISYDVDLGDGVGWRNRFSGFIRKWPLTWPGGTPFMALAPIEAVGVLGRLGRGNPPERSPMRRAIEGTQPVAYWPGEDGELSDQAGAATAGQPPLVASGTVEFKAVENYTFATSTTVFGTTALADLAAGGKLAARLSGEATAATAGGPWTVHTAILVDTLSTLSGDVVLLEWTTAGGTYTRWQVKVTTTSRTQLVGITAGGSSTLLIDHPSAAPTFHHYSASASVSGGTVTVRLQTSNSVNLTTTFGGTLGGVTSVAVNATGVTSTSAMPAGHVAVWAAAPIPVAILGATDAYGAFVREARRSWLGETATDRLVRLCAEDGIPLEMPAVPADSVQRMGVQPTAKPADLRQECEAVDGGLLYESGFGLGYLPRASRYNAPVELTIDNAAGQLGMPFAPVDDDQALRNRWTVERINGSSYTAVDPQSVELQGEIEASVRLNLLGDSLLPDQGEWRLHLSTAQEPRYQSVSVNVAAHRELAAAWCACRPGSRIQVTNPPAQNVPGVVDQVVVGATETYRGRRYWRVSLNVEPASPWDVATADGPQRAAGDGSALGVALGAGDTAAVITATPENGPWTQNPGNFPLPVRIGGEQVTVSAIAPVLTETFTRTVSGGWGSPDVGPAYVYAPSPGQFAVGGGEGLIGVNATGTTFAATVPDIGGDLDVVVRLRADAVAVGGFYQQMVRYRVGAGYVESVIRYHITGQIDLLLQTQSTVLAAVGNVLPYGAGSPFLLHIQAFGPTVRHTLWPAANSEPAWSSSVTNAPTGTGDSFALAAFRDAANSQAGMALAFDSVTFRTPQRATISARGANGVQRSWPAGTEVDVWQPAVAAL